MSICDTSNNKWSEIPYPGQKRVYHGLEKGSGKWPLYHLKRDGKGNYINGNTRADQHCKILGWHNCK